MLNITPRQQNILKILAQGNKTRAEIEEFLEKTYTISKATTVRELTDLLNSGFIDQKGAGPATYYTLKNIPSNIPLIDIDQYFKIDTDNRNILGEKFNLELLNKISSFFTNEELFEMDKTRISLAEKISSKSNLEVKKELERFVIELSWKSSQIEGNTYTLLDTESLIKNNVAVSGYTKQETQMILNHKFAFDYILKNVSEFEEFSLKSLHTIHALIVKDLDISYGYRTRGVGISGTKYLPLDNKFQIEDAMNKLEETLSKIDSPIVKAFGSLVFISYIQPFIDGNKRSARIMSNAILLANNYYPLSYRSVDEIYYKKALILFYEQFNIYYFKEIFKEQYTFSVNNYFLNS